MSEPISEIERAKWLLSGDREVTQRHPWDGIIWPLQECLGDLVALCEQKDQRIAKLESEVAKRNFRISQLTAELRHCSVFIRTKEKMHPHGIELFDQLLEARD